MRRNNLTIMEQENRANKAGSLVLCEWVIFLLKQGDRDIVLTRQKWYDFFEVKNMARKARRKSSTGIYHVILRGINRQNIFEDNEDRLKLFEDIAKYKEISQCRIFAYCFMDNHIHLLLQETQEPVSLMIQRVSSSYVIWYNRKHGRCGHLFQERFKSEAVENDSYFLTVLRYIHQNPVKAKIVSDVAAYKWSSYREYTEHVSIVDAEYALGILSDKRDEAISRLVRFLEEANNDVCLEIPDSIVKVSDEGLRQMVRQQFGMDATHICHETKERQEHILREMKEMEGATVRQIARVTGLSPTRVWKT